MEFAYVVYSFGVLACEPKDAMEDIEFIQDMKYTQSKDSAFEYSGKLVKDLEVDGYKLLETERDQDEFVKVYYMSDIDTEYNGLNKMIGTVVVIRRIPSINGVQRKEDYFWLIYLAFIQILIILTLR